MSTPKFTPGPWRVDGRWVYGTGRGFPVCEVPAGGIRHSKKDSANAHLMAVAPDGYRLAKLVVKYFGDDELDPLLDCDARLRTLAREILAKAEGS